ncbi:hypothetical protein SOPP22_06215 [Shewanella sp. OPT22]|nr:hypothetical protein SOPP22_06215 [Shewanella sp. OPT22]
MASLHSTIVASNNNMFETAKASADMASLRPEKTEGGTSSVTFKLKGCCKCATYTVSVNDQKQLQVQWQLKFFGKVLASKTVTNATNGFRYKTSQKLIQAVTASESLDKTIRFETMKKQLDQKGYTNEFSNWFREVVGSTTQQPALSGLQLCYLLRHPNITDKQMLKLIEQLTLCHSNNKYIEDMAKYLSPKQQKMLIEQLLKAPKNYNVVIKLLYALPNERHGTIIIKPFASCVKFAEKLDAKQFRLLCVSLDYQQSIALLQREGTCADLRESEINQSSLINKKFAVLKKEAALAKRTINGDGDIDLGNFPSPLYQDPKERATKTQGSTLQLKLTALQGHLNINLDEALRELNTFTSTEIALMLPSLTVSGFITKIIDSIPDEKLAIIMQLQQANSLNTILSEASTSSQAVLSKLTQLSCRCRQLASCTESGIDYQARIERRERQEFQEAFDAEVLNDGKALS